MPSSPPIHKLACGLWLCCNLQPGQTEADLLSNIVALEADVKELRGRSEPRLLSTSAAAGGPTAASCGPLRGGAALTVLRPSSSAEEVDAFFKVGVFC